MRVQVNVAADGVVQQLPEPVQDVLGRIRQPLQEAASAVRPFLLLLGNHTRASVVPLCTCCVSTPFSSL